MKIDVRKLNAEKKYAGDLSFETEGDETLNDIPFSKFSTPLKWNLHYEILEDDSVELTAKVTFSLKGECSRCLKDTEQTFEGEWEGYFTPVQNEEDYFYRQGVIDLSEFLRDAMFSAMPNRLLCGEDCSSPEYEK